MTTIDDREQDRGHVLRGDALHALAQVPAHAAGAEEADDGGGAEDDVPACRSRCRSRPRAPAAARRRRRPAAGWRRSRGSPRPGPGRIASIASENSLPAKPMQKSVSASAPGSMPKPSTITSRMVQIISWTERQRHDDEARRPVEEALAGRDVAGREPGERHRESRGRARSRGTTSAASRPPSARYSASQHVVDVGREVAARQHLAHAAEQPGQALEIGCSGSRSRTPGRRASRAGRRTCRGSADSGSGSRSRRRVGGARSRRPRAPPPRASWLAARRASPAQMTALRA